MFLKYAVTDRASKELQREAERNGGEIELKQGSENHLLNLRHITPLAKQARQRLKKAPAKG